MMSDNKVPGVVVSRLPWYIQTLNQMAREGLHTVSSQDLADRLGSSAAQIRKDLSYFGGFGKQGRGYSIYYLIEQLQKILNMDKIWPAIIVGAGDLGRALARYQGFANHGIEIVSLFDIDPKLIGTKAGTVSIQHVDSMENEVQVKGIKIAILTVPAEVAQEIADRLVKAGICAILNYAPVTLSVPSSTHVQYIDPVLHLQRMLFYLNED
jgi:redox-sensing transcriptional repressor